MSNLAT